MDSDLLKVLLQYGPGGVVALFVWLIYRQVTARLERENDDLKRALDRERERADAAVTAAGTTNMLLGALRELSGRTVGDDLGHVAKGKAARGRGFGPGGGVRREPGRGEGAGDRATQG